MGWRNYTDKVKRYFPFTQQEIKDFIIILVLFAFIHSFNKWGDVQFDFGIGIQNYAISLIVVGTALFIHHAGQRLAAAKYGLKAEQKLWWPGLLFGLIVVMLTRGAVQLFFASGLFIHTLKAHRLGQFRYQTNVSTYATVSLWGPLANILFGTFIKTLELWTPLAINAQIVQSIFVFNLWFAALNMLPVPPLDGSRVFYASRLIYAFVAGAIIGYVGLIYFFNIYSYIYALIIGIIVWLTFYLFFERHLVK